MDIRSDTTVATLIDEFSFFDDWEERYGHVIELGREMVPFTEDERTEERRVSGCASRVWLMIEDGPGGTLTITGDSDAFIVRGLIAILIRLLSGRSPAAIIALDVHAVLSTIGLSGQLTTQRANGLAAMARRIREEAAARM